MELRNLGRIGLLGLLLVPLLGSTCTKEKAIDFVVIGESQASFEARGSVNVDLGSEAYDLKEDLDLRQIAMEYGVDPEKIQGATFRQLFVRITKPDENSPDRSVTGDLTIQFRDLGSPPLPPRPVAELGSVSDFPANAVTEWQDVTDRVSEPGVDEINAFLARCLAELRDPSGASDATHTEVFYQWTGTSDPSGVETNFDWQAKVVLNVIATVDAEIPDF